MRPNVPKACWLLQKLQDLQTSLASQLHDRLDFSFPRNESYMASVSKWYVNGFTGATLKDFEFHLELMSNLLPGCCLKFCV